MLKVEVSYSPKLYPVYENDSSIVVVIDVLRATSAICTAFEHGVKEIIPVATIEQALEYKKQGYLVGAERNGEKVEGFDFGNSPYSYMSENIKGKSVVLTTTNGTKALDISRGAYKVVVGAFTNLTALCNWLIEEKRDVLLLCAGWKNRFNLEDTLFAGAVANHLANHNGLFTELSDSSLAARYLFQHASNDPYMFLRNSSHRRRLSRLNLKQDIKYCLQVDKTNVIPILEGKSLIKL